MKKPQLLFFLFVLLGLVSFSQNKPQEPKPPFDYAIEEVSFRNETDNIQMAGTLTYPNKGTEFPAIILISGSGPQDRNSELLGHKPFWVIADYLTSNGIAVLRVDDRGTGKTEGTYNATGLEGFVRDTESAIQFLKKHNTIDAEKIGLLGHSLGGTIAPIIASENEDIAFVIMLAGPTLRGDKLMLKQKELIETQMGVPEAQVVSGQTQMAGAYDIMFEQKDNPEALKTELKSYFKEIYGELLPESQLNGIVNQLTIPWLADLIRHDPVPYLKELNCPVLALYAEKDLQVPADENLEVIKAELIPHNPEVETKVMPGMNHLFQTCETGLPQEYATLEETFSPEVLELIGEWIKAQIQE